MALSEDFAAHIATGLTSVASCWVLTRSDGTVMGFTDHDRDLVVGGVTCRADTGLTARALEQTTGLAIDNSEALGALSDASVTEADIGAGRYDGAKVEAWLVNWQAPEQRFLQFRGYLGELTRLSGGFRAELIGLTEALNRQQGKTFQVPCTAVLGDKACKLDLSDPAWSGIGLVQAAEDRKVLSLSGFDGFADRWFERGRLTVLSGAAAGLSGVVKNDRLGSALRAVELWQDLRAEIAPGDEVRLEAGCDKAASTCRLKFGNIVNYRGFPDIPGEDRLVSVPVSVVTDDQTGGSAGSSK